MRRDVTSSAANGPRRGSRWVRALIDAALASALVAVSWLFVDAALDRAERNEQLRLVASEARALHAAFARYYEQNRAFPATHTAPRFELDTLDPLRRRGYYRGPLTQSLDGGRVDAYDSPDDLGPNHEFWLEMSLARDPSIRFLIARSDDAPLGGGRWRDGVYLFRDGVLTRL